MRIPLASAVFGLALGVPVGTAPRTSYSFGSGIDFEF